MSLAAWPTTTEAVSVFTMFLLLASRSCCYGMWIVLAETTSCTACNLHCKHQNPQSVKAQATISQVNSFAFTVSLEKLLAPLPTVLASTLPAWHETGLHLSMGTFPLFHLVYASRCFGTR